MKSYHFAIPLLSNDVTLPWPLNNLPLLIWRHVQGVFPTDVGGEGVGASVQKAPHARPITATTRRHQSRGAVVVRRLQIRTLLHQQLRDFSALVGRVAGVADKAQSRPSTWRTPARLLVHVLDVHRRQQAADDLEHAPPELGIRRGVVE